MLFRLEKRLSGAPAPAAADAFPNGAGAPNGMIVERPPPGLARGTYPASPWTIALLCAALLLITVSYFVVRWRRLRS